MKFYWLKPVESPRFTGEYNATRRWSLPGIHCPLCDATWSSASDAYPCVDLSRLEEHEKFSSRLEEDYAEFERLCALVQPLVPSGARLRPGTKFGPLVGSARGAFGHLVMQYSWALLIRREVLEQLQAAGVRGLLGCGTELRFRQKNAPELLELQIESGGLLHPDCLPARSPPCGRCGRDTITRPALPLLDAASLPGDRDLFRLTNFHTMLIGTERFVEAVRRFGFGEVALHEVSTRQAPQPA